MKSVFPPIGVLVIVIIGVVLGVWRADPPQETTHVALNLPINSYQKLAVWAKDQTISDGRPVSVEQIIDAMVIKRERRGGAKK